MIVLERLVEALEGAVALLGRLAALTCIVLVLVVAGNVLARYFFSAGAIWLQELEWHLISPIALFGMSYALLAGEQVRVDVLYERFPAGLKRAVEVLTGLLLALFAAWMVTLSLPFVAQSWRLGEGSPNPGGLPFRFALKSLIPLGFALLSAQGLCHALRHAVLMRSRG
ncbi:TRAP transporter small permease subunit [Salinarimonas rosea]|uniref:TRAP transporter small permease subunit n=1 Tax=Salinarimonas rosea TaxID=552063 RepID=UPI000415EA1F|nr:TRAP transporter small permease subunit [Salinarimonas rosea]